MKEAEVIEVYTPKEVSKILKVESSTLRKYSGLIDKQNEKLNGKPYFQRDDSNSRIYDSVAVDLLKRIIELKIAPGMTLYKAVELAMIESNMENHVASESANDIATESPKRDDISVLHKKIDFIGNQLQKLLDQNEKLIKENQQLRLSLEQPKEESLLESESVKEKQSFFTRLFNKK